MNIGIDLDNTICNTSEIINYYLKDYSTETGMDIDEIVNDGDLKQSFFNIYLKDIYTNVKAKKEAIEFINKLKSRGNKIYIITARSSDITFAIKDVKKITLDWLNKNNLSFDQIVFSVYGDNKKEACNNLNIDIMIDDDIYNFERINSGRTRCFLYDEENKYKDNKNIFRNWKEIENYFERGL